MRDACFKLQAKPFGLSPEGSFLLYSAGHNQARMYRRYGLL